MGLINVGVSAGAKLLSIPFFAVLYEHRARRRRRGGSARGRGSSSSSPRTSATTGSTARTTRCALLWAAHVNHHSSQHYNLSTALRQPLLTPFTGPVFWAPLALLGFPPWMILTAQAWSLLYQFWLHTEAIDRLGPLEWILNTPSHHRVHHGKNVPYLDKNHGGILIIWDRLFGTFAREERAASSTA